MKIYKIAALCLIVPFIQAGQTNTTIDQQGNPERTVRTINNDDVIRPEDILRDRIDGAELPLPYVIRACEEALSYHTGMTVTYNAGECEMSFTKIQTNGDEWTYIVPLTSVDRTFSETHFDLKCRRDQKCVVLLQRGKDSENSGFDDKIGLSNFGRQIRYRPTQVNLEVCFKRLHEACK